MRLIESLIESCCKFGFEFVGRFGEYDLSFCKSLSTIASIGSYGDLPRLLPSKSEIWGLTSAYLIIFLKSSGCFALSNFYTNLSILSYILYFSYLFSWIMSSSEMLKSRISFLLIPSVLIPYLIISSHLSGINLL